jgi:ABC-type oligopeptide transport system substrate-binding subunit
MALYGQVDRMLMEEAVIMPVYYLKECWLQKPWVVSAANLKDFVIKPH